MRLVKIGLASVNTTVGATQGNVERALRFAREMAAADVTVAAYPEQMIGGYPPEDLIQWQGFVEAQWRALEHFAKETRAQSTVHVLGVAVLHEGLRYGCAAIVAGGEIRGLVPKEKLPTYSIYYEGRTFSRGFPYQLGEHKGVPFGDLIFRFDFGVLAPEVCEDAWTTDCPMRRRTYSGAELVVNISGSAFRVGTDQTRREMLITRAGDHQCTLAYVNLVGGNDGLLFDGGGFVFQNGKMMLDAPRWREGWEATTVDLDRTMRLRSENTTWRMDHTAWATSHEPVPTIEIPASEFRTRREKLTYPVPANGSFFLPVPEKQVPARTRYCEDVLDALAMGVGDYFEKNRVFKNIGVALSGGRDSLLTLLIAHRWASRKKPEAPGSLLRAFYMPSRYSSAETEKAARTVCDELGIPLRVVSIDAAFERELEAVRAMLQPGEQVTPLTEQNIQARLRGQRMWSWSNSSGGLFLQTGNMSERAVGYTTVGGDLEGALAVISNVPKTVVMVLLDYLQEVHPLEGIRLVLQKPPGPELAPNQVGEEELMPFRVLDACFHLFADEKLLPEEVEQIVGGMFPDLSKETVHGYVTRFVKMFLTSIYKWVQAPLSLHIGNLDLDRERALQLPVVTYAEWALKKK
ncbi:MAG TPA: NAD(+) synthase [Myxococcaceae bacterium]|nr:NAD(+) synthase [Myxococcaceae bacterium]